MKDIKALLLLVVSAGLLGTWIYYVVDRNRTSKKIKSLLIKDTTTTQNRMKDSLQAAFTEAMHQMNAREIDTLRGELGSHINEIFKLRNEIFIILKNRKITKADLDTAKQKISELQQRIDEIKAQNSSLEDERLQLSNTLDQLTSEMKTLQENMQRLGLENKELTQTINEASTFIISEIKLKAMDERGGRRDVETSHAKKASKFVFSFIVQNNIVRDSSSEIYVIITDPAGQVLQNNLWESGIFASNKDSSKNYTTKMAFEYHKGESKKVNFTLEVEKFQKGIYKMEVYHNGLMIGETTKKLD